MPRTMRPRSVSPRGVALRTLVAVASVLTLSATGAGWWATHGVLNGFTVSAALSADSERSSGGALNILLMGLDTRKDQQGNDLPQELLDQLHAGDSSSGGYNTNTLILVHITADNRVTAFSIPRDDYVPFTHLRGYHNIKIKKAYGLTKAAMEQMLTDQGVTDQALLEAQGREAGRAATLSAVRSLVGVPIDHFAEVSLAGFYDLAAAFGGVEVCLNHAVHDSYSGANFPAGRQTLNASQAVAFVRQRHGLENGDLDRTHRQQAFLVSVTKQLQDAGTFSDLTKLQRLMDVAQRDIVLSSGWDAEQLQRLGTIAGADVQYQTLPIVRYARINGEDVNIVDPAQIKAQVQAAFADGATPVSSEPRPSSIVDVVNAGRTSGLALSISRKLVAEGFTAGEVRDLTYGESGSTAVRYGFGAESDATVAADLLGGDIAIRSDSELAAGHIQIVLGVGYLPGSAGDAENLSASALADSGSATAVSPATRSTRSSLTAPTPDGGPPVVGGDGIPCVD